jgi:hypothetical protein
MKLDNLGHGIGKVAQVFVMERSRSKNHIHIGIDIGQGNAFKCDPGDIARVAGAKTDKNSPYFRAFAAPLQSVYPRCGKLWTQQGEPGAQKQFTPGRNEWQVVGVLATRGLVEKEIANVATISEIVDDHDTPCPRPASDFEFGIAFIVIDDQEIAPVWPTMKKSRCFITRIRFERYDFVPAVQ